MGQREHGPRNDFVGYPFGTEADDRLVAEERLFLLEQLDAVDASQRGWEDDAWQRALDDGWCSGKEPGSRAYLLELLRAVGG